VRTRFLLVVLMGCISLSAMPIASTLASPVPLGGSSSTSVAAVSGSAVVAEAERYLGYPYAETGNSPSTGFSCIGFAWFVYHQLGMNIPGTVNSARFAYPQVAESQLLPGDLVFFQGTFAGLYPASHVGIYIGGGKMISAENFSVGVRISSLRNDPSEGSYWQDHYLSANRPWTGGGGQVPGNGGRHGGHIVTVLVPSLNVRSGPGYGYGIVTVLTSGQRVRIEGWRPGWVRIKTFSGTIGWVIRSGVSIRPGGGAQHPSAGSSAPRHHVAGRARRAAWARGKTIYVYGLRVHSSPSASAAVIATLSRGNRVGVFGRYGAWDKILMASGTVGWVMARYVGRHVAASGNRSSAGSVHRRGHTLLRAGVNIRSRPNMQASIVAVSNGAPVRVLHWAPGWADVQLSTGASGWVWRAFLGGYHARRAIQSRSGGQAASQGTSGAHATAGVRVHVRPGFRAGVIAFIGQGTRVVVLRSTGSWDYVRLPGGTRGWVDAAYVAG
jgi:uncharacterized protein YgiM (DUF1202 family)